MQKSFKNIENLSSTPVIKPQEENPLGVFTSEEWDALFEILFEEEIIPHPDEVILSDMISETETLDVPESELETNN